MTSRSEDEVGKHEKPGLGTFLSIMLSSDVDNQIVIAARQVRKLLKAEGLDGHDVARALEQRNKLLEAAEQRDKLLEAAKRLKAERDQLQAENERLNRLQHANGAGNGFAQQLWQTAGVLLTVSNKAASWLLGLQAQGHIHLTAKESDFVNSCARRRRLTQNQEPWLHDLVDRAIARGFTPPP